MLGDWDLQSTLLRRTLQEGARRVAVLAGAGNPCWLNVQKNWPDFNVALSALHAACATIGQPLPYPAGRGFCDGAADGNPHPAGLAGVGGSRADSWRRTLFHARVAWCRSRADTRVDAARSCCRPVGDPEAETASRSNAEPASVVAGGRSCAARHRLVGNAPWPGWGALVTAGAACAFAEGARIEKAGLPAEGELWLLSRRGAIFLAIPFAIAGIWTAYLLAVLLYAALSFFIVQRVRHSTAVDGKLTQIG